MIKAVIFDLDDTLYPERAYAFSGFAAVAAEMTDILGEPEPAVARMRSLFDTDDRARVFDLFLVERDRPEERSLLARMIAIYRGHAPVIEFYPDADAALTRLRRSCRLGLITDGRAGQQRAKIDALGLRRRLDEIIVTAELSATAEPGATGGLSASVSAAKPSPIAFERMAQRLDVEPAACAYVADNPTKDFVAPNALGWRTVQVFRPDGIYRDLPPARGGAAKHQIDTLDALDTVLT